MICSDICPLLFSLLFYSPSLSLSPFSFFLQVTQPKAIRQSVLQLANNIMDHSGEDGESSERYSWTPQPANHQIEEHSPYVNTQISQSSSIPDRRHTASPLSHVQRKYPLPGALGEKGFDNMPPVGQVHEMKKRFSLQHSRPHRSSVSRNSSHVPIVVSHNQEPSLQPSSGSNDEEETGGKSHRPMSWDATEILEEDEGSRLVRREERGESLPPPERPSSDALFQRNAQIRQPFRQKTAPTAASTSDSETLETNDTENVSSNGVKPHPPLTQQISNPTKPLDEVLELFEEGASPEDPEGEDKVKTSTKMSKLSVRDRTKIWEMKAGSTQTLPRSFKTRNSTGSQPCSPMRKNSVESPLPTPNSLSNQPRFNFIGGDERR